jgi:hypothetical protein
MLRATFLHVPGIGETTERDLWEHGVTSWDCLLDDDCSYLSATKRDKLEKYAKASLNALNDQNHEFFANQLKSRHHWRSYPEFEDGTCFLDIETTGLSKERHVVTTVGIYDGTESKVFVRGEDLDAFPQYMQRFNHIVTFNGARFDLPFLEHNLNMSFSQLHTDLRFLLARLGYKGGLKEVEKEFGIGRGDLDGMSGADAVRLWHRYERGDDDALQTLIRYNKEDIENLRVLMREGYDMMKDHVF